MGCFFYLTGKLEQPADEIVKTYSSFGLENTEVLEYQWEDASSFLEKKEFDAVMIGYPYGRKVQQFADIEGFGYKRTGSGNILYKEKDAFTLDNTDFLALLRALSLKRAKINGKKVLVFGRGAAAKALREAFKERHAGLIWQVPAHEISAAVEKTDAEIIVNATPSEIDMELSSFPYLELVIDLLPRENTLLLDSAKERHIPVINGKEIFRLQAEMSAEIIKNIKYKR